MDKIISRIEHVVVVVVSAALATGILTDDGVIPHSYQHLAGAVAALVMYIAYQSAPPRLVGKEVKP